MQNCVHRTNDLATSWHNCKYWLETTAYCCKISGLFFLFKKCFMNGSESRLVFTTCNLFYQSILSMMHAMTDIASSKCATQLPSLAHTCITRTRSTGTRSRLQSLCPKLTVAPVRATKTNNNRQKIFHFSSAFKPTASILIGPTASTLLRTTLRCFRRINRQLQRRNATSNKRSA